NQVQVKSCRGSHGRCCMLKSVWSVANEIGKRKYAYDENSYTLAPIHKWAGGSSCARRDHRRCDESFGRTISAAQAASIQRRYRTASVRQRVCRRSQHQRFGWIENSTRRERARASSPFDCGRLTCSLV